MKKIIYLLILGFVFSPFCSFSQTATAPKKKKYGFTPALIRGPYLQAATPTSMVVRWRTDENDVSFVRYGLRPDKLDRLAGNSNRIKEHIVTLNGLEPDTKYYYLIEGVRDTLQGDENNHFRTLPPLGAKGKYRIGAFGDCGNNSTNQRLTRDAFEKYLGKEDLNAWILLGDNAYSFGKDEEYQTNFFDIYKDGLLKKAPLFPAPGNHDYHDTKMYAEFAQQSAELAYYKIFTMPTMGEAGGVPSRTQAFYSYDIGNIHFLSIDSHGEEDYASRLFDTSGRQVKWIKEDLEQNKHKDWIIAYWHHPPYSMGSHNSDTEMQMRKIRENFVSILERYGVDLVLCGHSHSYERSGLMKGHLGLENSFDAATHQLSNSSAKYDGSSNSCPYIKDESNQGTVYVVSGSAGALDYAQASFPHDAMQYADVSIGGASLIEVENNRLDLKWIASNGEVKDQFTIMKKLNKRMVVTAKKGEKVTLTASYPGQYIWEGMNKTTRSIEVTPKGKTTVYVVKDPQNCIRQEFEVKVQ